MMDMMNSTTEVIVLMVVLVLALGSILIGVRLVLGKQFNRDHDR